MNNKDYSSLTLKKETKEKLNEFKGDNSYEKAIDMLLQNTGGVLLSDIEEIKRPQVAFELTTIEYCGNEDNLDIYGRYYSPVTFEELANSKVGDEFESPYPNLAYNYKEWAEIIFKDDISVFVRVYSEYDRPDCKDKDIHLLHIQLF